MSVSSRMLTFVEQHDGVTNSDIATALGLDRAMVSARMSQQRHKMYRELDTSVNPPRYIWYAKHKELERVSPPVVEGKAEPQVKPQYAGLFEQAMDAVVSSFVDNIIVRFEERVVSELHGRMGEVIGRIPKQLSLLPEKKAQERRKSICIVGLLPQQAGIISHEFNDVFDFKFIESSERNAHMKSAVTHSDVTIVMTGFVSHATVELIEAQHVKPLFASGGMTRLRDMLTSMYVSD